MHMKKTHICVISDHFDFCAPLTSAHFCHPQVNLAKRVIDRANALRSVEEEKGRRRQGQQIGSWKSNGRLASMCG